MSCNMEEDQDLLHRGRGSFDFHVDMKINAKLTIVTWANNKTVTLVSSSSSVSVVGQVMCYSEEEKRKITVQSSKIVSDT